MKLERRIIRTPEIRASEDGKTIIGYAAVFNSLSDDLGWFREKIRPGAFSKCLAGDPDVRCLFNHDSNLVLGRTRNGTLDLLEDDKGLKFECQLPDTQTARDLRALIERGDVSQCSFGFYVLEQAWEEKKVGDQVETTREIIECELFDVSPVTFPAYPATSVEARTLWPEGEPEEIAKRHTDTQSQGSAPACASLRMRLRLAEIED